MGTMLGRPYKTIEYCRWRCCPGHSLRTKNSRHSLKRLRARERKVWRRDVD